MKINQKIIREIINHIDPINLSPGVATPEEEYDPEVTEIIRIISDYSSPMGLEKELDAMFNRLFGEDHISRLENYKLKLDKLVYELNKISEK